MKNVQASDLRHQVAIQSNSGFDSNGEPENAWTTVATVWAALTPSSGSERYINQQVVAEVTHLVTIRYRSGITPKMRILYHGRSFDVLQVIDTGERHIELRLVCKELTIGGIG